MSVATSLSPNQRGSFLMAGLSAVDASNILAFIGIFFLFLAFWVK